MNKFGQKIRDCGHPRISSARSGAAMASVRHWAVPAVMAAALMLSGCQTLNPDSAEGESNSVLKTLLVAIAGGAAYWGSTDSGSDSRPLLPTLVDPADRLAGPFGEAVALEEDGQVVQYRIDTPSLDRRAGGDGFQIAVRIPIGFTLANGDCAARRCVVTIPPGQHALGLILEPLPDAVVPPSPPMVSLIPSDDYDIQRILTFRDPVIQGSDLPGEIGRAVFTVFSNAPTSAGDDRFVLRFQVDGIVPFDHVPGANPTTCDDQTRICEVTIPTGETSAELIIVPENPNPLAIPEWRLSLAPDDNDNYDILPTLGFFAAEPSVTQGGRATFTIISNTPAPRGGLEVMVNIDGETFDIEETDAGRLAAIAAIVGSQANHVACEGSICTVIIREGEISATFRLIPLEVPDPGAAPRWTVSLIPAGINDPFEIENANRGAPLPVNVANTPTGVRGGFSPLEVIGTGGSRQFSTETPELDRAAGPDGFDIAFTLPPNLRPVADQTVEVDGRTVPVTVTCQPIPTACTVTIPETQTQLVLMFEPIDPADTTAPVAIVLPEPENNEYSLLPEPPTPPAAFVVGFDTPEPTVVNPENGNATVTFVSDTVAPALGLTVSIRITGDDFTATLPDGTTAVPCNPSNVCTVVILEGSDTAAFILVPEGPRSPDSDLFTRWTVAIIDDPDNIYGIDENNPTAAVAIGLLTPIAAGETIVFDENTLVRFGDGNAPFRAFGQGNAQPDVLDIPSAAPVLAESEADSFDSGFYGHFADDGTVLPSAAELEELFGIVARYGGSFSLGNTNPATGEVELTFTPLGSPAPADGFPISFRVSGLSGSNDFTAARNDAADPADRTPVSCLGDVCTVTIPVGETALPGGNSLILSPTMAPSILDGILAPVWMVMQSTQEPGLVNPLLFNRASSDEAVFYARRGNQLVARFETSGTLRETATVQEIIFPAFNGVIPNFPSNICAGVPPSSGGIQCSQPTFNARPEVRLLVVGDDPGGRFRAPRLGLSVGDTIPIDRPVAIALAITSTLVATADDAQELVYSYFRDSDGNGDPDVNPETGGFFFDEIVGTVDFALYESGDIPTPSDDAFSINELDSGTELLGASNVRTFLFENEFSAIGAWLIPPTAEEVTADADAPYAAAAAHWFGFETPADRIPTTGEAVYGGIAIGDLRQVRFGFADTDSDPSTPPAQISTNVESYYVRGFAQFDADFGNDEMDGRVDLFAYDPRDVYGDPTQLLSSQPLDLLIVNWEGQILPDGGGFANNFESGTETVEVFDLDTSMPIMITRDTFAATGTLEQPLRATVEDRDGNPIPQAARIPVFDNLVDFDRRIGGVDPSQPAPISSDTLFSVFGKFFGPGLGAFPEEVAGELRVFNSLNVFMPETTDNVGNVIPESDETVTNILEVHFTADEGPVPMDRFEE